MKDTYQNGVSIKKHNRCKQWGKCVQMCDVPKKRMCETLMCKQLVWETVNVRVVVFIYTPPSTCTCNLIVGTANCGRLKTFAQPHHSETFLRFWSFWKEKGLWNDSHHDSPHCHRVSDMSSVWIACFSLSHVMLPLLTDTLSDVSSAAFTLLVMQSLTQHIHA